MTLPVPSTHLHTFCFDDGLASAGTAVSHVKGRLTLHSISVSKLRGNTAVADRRYMLQQQKPAVLLLQKQQQLKFNTMPTLNCALDCQN